MSSSGRSSPDPLFDAAAPSIAEPRSSSKRRSTTPSKHATKNRSSASIKVDSPRKMRATSNTVLSPWRIKVMVEAERDGEEGSETPSRKGKNKRALPNFSVGFGGLGDDDDFELPAPKVKRTVMTRTRTTKVPLKGLSSDDETEPATKATVRAKRTSTPAARKVAATPRAKSSVGRTPRKSTTAAPKPALKPATPRRKRTTPARAPEKKVTAIGDDDETETPMEDIDELAEMEASRLSHCGDIFLHPAVESWFASIDTCNICVRVAPAMCSPAAKISTRITRTTRPLTQRTIAPPPTLASTRSRRSSTAPLTPILAGSKRITRAASVVTNENPPNSAFSGNDINFLITPSPSKSNSSVRSRSSFRNGSGLSGQLHEGEDTIVVSQPGSAIRAVDKFMGAARSLPEFARPTSLSSYMEESEMDEYPTEQDVDMCEESALADVTMDPGFTYMSAGRSYTPITHQKPPQVIPTSEGSVGINPFCGEEEDQDEEMPTSSVLPEESSDAVEADFIYYSSGASYAPRGGTRTAFAQPGSSNFEDDPTDATYRPPSSSKRKYKGKGKAVEGTDGEITSEKLSPGYTQKEQSFYPSSPPFTVVISAPSASGGTTTPAQGQKRGHGGFATNAPVSDRRANREIPSLIGGHEVGELMTDHLDLDEPMAKVQQNLGNHHEAPPTPESQVHSSMDHDSKSHSNLTDTSTSAEDGSSVPANDTGIPSPTPSRDKQAKWSSPDDAPGILSRILSPLKRAALATQVPNSAAHVEEARAQTPTRRSCTPMAHLVRFEDETSAEGRQRLFERTAMMQADWAKEREENVKHAEEVGAITVNDTMTIQEMRAASTERTKALLAEWERERLQVRQQANEMGAIVVDDTATEVDEESFEASPTQSFATAPTTQSFIESRGQSFSELPVGQSFSESYTDSRGQSFSTFSESQGQSFSTWRTQSFSESRGQSFTNLPVGQSFSESRSRSRSQSFESQATEVFQGSGPSAHNDHHSSATPQPAIPPFPSSSKTTAPISSTPHAGDSVPDSLLDSITTVTNASSTTKDGLVWKAEHYENLEMVLSSKSTNPAEASKCYKVQLDRPERLLSREVMASLDVDADGFLRLDRKESAAVERFLRREKAVGRDWGLVEVVRRVAGMKVAESRRQWLKAITTTTTTAAT
ncbi:hypothetical protein FN846DRAFT_894015 [Sphaerosporella brunnea]|uniref:Uncharacterized protein n=1 Tax=Sphaerosporella brunnea TaxID=1250544 RepID=A0A5J5EK77_9PEZI|nr:hypothetical protein FN846DRAFT_894015 [Sphaerosporella brunnea]